MNQPEPSAHSSEPERVMLLNEDWSFEILRWATVCLYPPSLHGQSIGNKGSARTKLSIQLILQPQLKRVFTFYLSYLFLSCCQVSYHQKKLQVNQQREESIQSCFQWLEVKWAWVKQVNSGKVLLKVMFAIISRRKRASLIDHFLFVPKTVLL